MYLLLLGDLGSLLSLKLLTDNNSGSEQACKVAGVCESPATSMDAGTGSSNGIRGRAALVEDL